MMMKSAEDGRRYDAVRVLDGAMDRSVLVERPMSPKLIIVGGILPAVGHTRSSRRYKLNVRFPESGHAWAIYEYMS
jgi:hypothetical protein